jgi:alkanesulfonate monooxygenase SsuD/methylene tetrahydromethanopterin reductase-like flavin-dependent oxidoreductase (luciferase family)
MPRSIRSSASSGSSGPSASGWAGRPPRRPRSSRNATPDRATAIADARPFLEEKYRAYRQWGQDQALPPGEHWSDEFAELARDRFILGDPATVREEIHRHRERLGVTTMILRTQWPGMAQAKVLRSITLLGERVFPHVR